MPLKIDRKIQYARRLVRSFRHPIKAAIAYQREQNREAIALNEHIQAIYAIVAEDEKLRVEGEELASQQKQNDMLWHWLAGTGGGSFGTYPIGKSVSQPTPDIKTEAPSWPPFGTKESPFCWELDSLFAERTGWFGTPHCNKFKDHDGDHTFDRVGEKIEIRDTENGQVVLRIQEDGSGTRVDSVVGFNESGPKFKKYPK